MTDSASATGPLAGIRIVELSGMGPVPFAGRMLSDLGADIIRIDRTVPAWPPGIEGNPYDVNARGRRSVAVDLKDPGGAELVLTLLEDADALLEGYRPGIMERLGLGPDVCLDRNPRLVYGRCSGWGRSGPLAMQAGHDLSYVALSGALSLIGPPHAPPPPVLGFLGDHGGGGMLLLAGVLAGLLEARTSGLGQVVDASILDGALVLTAPEWDLLAQGARTDERWSYLSDGSAPFMNTYETADGGYVAVSAVEPKFYAELLELVGLGAAELATQHDRSRWPAMKERLAERFLTRTRDEWAEAAEGTDACLAPVLKLSEVPSHPHHVDRGSFVDVGGVAQPAPFPRFGRTQPGTPNAHPRLGEHTRSALTSWGVPDDEVSRLLDSGVLVDNSDGQRGSSGR